MEVKEKKIWISALRSGRFKQGRSKLHHAGRHCCLGVCSLVLRDDMTKEEKECDKAELTSEFMTSIGLSYSAAMALMAMNDSHNKQSSFEQIADYIEKNL